MTISRKNPKKSKKPRNLWPGGGPGIGCSALAARHSTYTQSPVNWTFRGLPPWAGIDQFQGLRHMGRSGSILDGYIPFIPCFWHFLGGLSPALGRKGGEFSEFSSKMGSELTRDELVSFRILLVGGFDST